MGVQSKIFPRFASTLTDARWAALTQGRVYLQDQPFPRIDNSTSLPEHLPERERVQQSASQEHSISFASV